MSQGNDFANYASSVGDQSTASEDVWFVAVSSDDIKQMNLDQLDEAFRLGIVTAHTAVWTEGMEAWAPLGEVADLDSHGEAHGVEQSEVRPAEPAAASYASSAASANLGNHVGSALFGAGASSYAPQASSSFAPVTSNNMFSSSPSSLGQSTGPVALNVDEDSPPARRGRGWRPERWLLAAAGVIGAGVVGHNVMGSSSSSVAAAEKSAVAATTSASHAYEAPPERGTTRPAAVKEELPAAKADDSGKDAPIGSVPSSSPEEAKEEATDAPSSAKGAKDTKDSKDSLRGGVAKAFSGKKGSSKASSSGKSAKGSKGHKVPSRATASRATSSASSKSSKKSSVTHAASAFDPLNGSLP